MTRVTDGVSYDNEAPGTFGPFSLVGGIYQVGAKGLSAGSATLEMQVPGTAVSPTYLSVEVLSADGGATLYLPPGRYQFVLATDSGVTMWVYKVPVE